MSDQAEHSDLLILLAANSTEDSTSAFAMTSTWRRVSYRMQEHLKRLLDLALVVLAIPVLLPVILILSLLVKFDSTGPIFFNQDQLGRGGRRIRPWKFRTMHVGAEEMLQKILAEGGPLAEEYRQFHKLKKDPRVTRIGRFLRKTSLDELPQVWNVLRGDMSLVGPRPYLPRELPDMLGHEHVILQKRPGITGLWQVSGRNKATFEQRLAMDLHYVRTWSLWRDLGILLLTFRVVILGTGAA